MARPNALVDQVRELVHPAAPRALETRTVSVPLATVTFGGGRTGLLDMASFRSKVWAEVLQSLTETRQPAYVEIDPRTGLISEVLLPIRYTVHRVAPTKEGVEVELLISHARHYLRLSHPEFAEMRRTLEAAQKSGKMVLVTETLEEHEIIDVRPAESETTPANSPPRPARTPRERS